MGNFKMHQYLKFVVEGKTVELPVDDPEVVFVLEEQLGMGAQGDVYAARAGTDRFVVKILESMAPEKLSFEKLRFLDEFKINADRMRNVARLQDWFIHSRVLNVDNKISLVIVTDHIEGVSLGTFVNWFSKERKKDILSWLTPGPTFVFSPAQFRELALQCMRGLDSIHRLGFVHRDIKPANIVIAGPKTKEDFSARAKDMLRGETNEVFLIDFDASFILGDYIFHPSMSRCECTLGYLSPEMLNLRLMFHVWGEFSNQEVEIYEKEKLALAYMQFAKYFTPRFQNETDQWALAVSLYEVIALEKPFPYELPVDPRKLLEAIQKQGFKRLDERFYGSIVARFINETLEAQVPEERRNFSHYMIMQEQMMLSEVPEGAALIPAGFRERDPTGPSRIIPIPERQTMSTGETREEDVMFWEQESSTEEDPLKRFKREFIDRKKQ